MMHVRDVAVRHLRSALECLLLVFALLATGSAGATQCGTGTYPFPFTDVAGVADPFCPGIMESYVTGVSKGTTPTTFSPSALVDRTQMTTFLQRSLDQGLRRGSPRAALGQWWTSTDVNAMQSVTSVGNPLSCVSDGDSVWVTNSVANTVTQFAASTGKVAGTWTGATGAGAVLAAAGRVFVTAASNPGQILLIDPTQSPGAMTLAATVPGRPVGLAFDGAKLWATNFPSPATGNGGLSIITVQAALPYPTTPVTAGLGDLVGIVYDGKNIWVADRTANKLHKLDSAGAILQTVGLPVRPQYIIYDGANLWVTSPQPGPNGSLVVVQASTGAIVASIVADANNGINAPQAPSFDGERVLVPSYFSNSVAIFKAADLGLLGKVDVGANSGPTATCGDGVSTWVPLSDLGRVVRF